MELPSHVTRIWAEIEQDGDDLKTVLVVETDLEMWHEAPGFNGRALDHLLDDLTDIFHNPRYDRMRLIPKKGH